MKRGAVVVVALPGDTGKPRPAVVLRADPFRAHNRVTLLPLTSETQPAPTLRVDLMPSPENGLRVACQAMVDRISRIAAVRVSQVVGELAERDMRAISQAVAVYLGLAD